jgi:Tol biopolymer transport system component
MTMNGTWMNPKAAAEVAKGLALTTVLAAAPATAGTSERMSVEQAAAPSNGTSIDPAISANGRFVAFASTASNLVPGDSNNREDVFVRDRQTGTTERVSVRTGGGQSNNPSSMPTLSADGRFVAFASAATNLVPGDTNNGDDVFVHDRRTGTTERVSVRTGGSQGNGSSAFFFPPALSANGRFVVFDSFASNLVAGDSNLSEDVFVHDRQTGTTERVSVGSDGTQGAGNQPAISAGGRFVAFQSEADSLVAGDTNEALDVFVRDRRTGRTERVSVGPSGIQANGHSEQTALSADGRFVQFVSEATNLVPGDSNRAEDVFVHDRRTGITERISLGPGGVQANGFSGGPPTASSTGRFVAFNSIANNLVPGGTSGIDLFVRDRRTRRTELVSVGPGGTEANGDCHDPALSADGRFVAFSSFATNLAPDDTDTAADVFVRDRQTGRTELVSVGDTRPR